MLSMFVVSRRGPFATFFFAFAALLASTGHGLGETLRVGGTGAALGTMKMLPGPFATSPDGQRLVRAAGNLLTAQR